MADYKPKEVYTVTADDCYEIDATSPQWDNFHMACWICCNDHVDGRKEMMYNDFCEMYFHRSCIEKREQDIRLSAEVS
jgi:hypothetical protein